MTSLGSTSKVPSVIEYRITSHLRSRPFKTYVLKQYLFVNFLHAHNQLKMLCIESVDATDQCRIESTETPAERVITPTQPTDC